MNTFKTHLIESRITMRSRAVDRVREYVEDLAKELANNHDTYESFFRHINKLIPQLEKGPGNVIILPNETGPIHIDLKWFWQEYNETEKQKFDNAWKDQ